VSERATPVGTRMIASKTQQMYADNFMLVFNRSRRARSRSGRIR
jgi:hypothetical protein